MTEMRAATADDVCAMAAVQLRAALDGFAGLFPVEAPPPTPEQLEQQWASELASDAGAVLVATDGSDVVGTVVASPHASVGELRRLYVDPTRWGLGIGGRLHDAALAHLRTASCTTATLWVLEGNRRARAMYERRGWTYAPDGGIRVVFEDVHDVLYRLDGLAVS
jgi:GNAT superfamily N-acetyltransferase